jgi:hypothetical protein
MINDDPNRHNTPVSCASPQYGVISNDEWEDRIKNANPHLPENVMKRVHAAGFYKTVVANSEKVTPGPITKLSHTSFGDHDSPYWTVFTITLVIMACILSFLLGYGYGVNIL